MSTEWHSKFQNLAGSLGLWLAIGGAAIVVAPLALLLPDSASHFRLHYLLLIFSFPHFIQTYFSFYGKEGSWKKHPRVSQLAPLLLIGALIAAHFAHLDYYVLQAATLLFFWHIGKQAFGVAWYFVPNAAKDLRFRYLILATALLFSFAGWLHLQGMSENAYVFKSRMNTLAFGEKPFAVVQLIAWYALAFTTLVAFKRLRSYPKSRLYFTTVLFSLAACISPRFGLVAIAFLPIMHGFQYLGISALATKTTGRSNTLAFLLYAGSAAAGWAVFVAFPENVVSFVNNASWIVASVYLFANVHHFLIDGVMWKRDSSPLINQGFETQVHTSIACEANESQTAA